MSKVLLWPSNGHGVKKRLNKGKKDKIKLLKYLSSLLNHEDITRHIRQKHYVKHVFLKKQLCLCSAH